MVCRTLGCDSVAVAFWLLPLPCPAYNDRCAPDRVLSAKVPTTPLLCWMWRVYRPAMTDYHQLANPGNDTHEMTTDDDDR